VAVVSEYTPVPVVTRLTAAGHVPARIGPVPPVPPVAPARKVRRATGPDRRLAACRIPESKLEPATPVL
jgi:hypothetical protein